MSRARRRTVKALVALGSILAFLSVFAIWVERQALDTGDWVGTSSRLLEDSTIRKALGDYLVDQLYENVDVEKELKEILPGETKQFSGPLSGGLRQVAGDGAEKVLETSTAQSLWEEANRTTHRQLVEVLEEKGDTVSTENGEVKLNLGALLTNLADQVGIGASLAERLPPDAGQITILKSDQLKTAQNVTIAVKGLALVLSLLTFLCLAGAIYLSRESRWVTVLFCGIGLIAAGFAAIVARRIVGGIVVGQLVTADNVKPAAEAAWTIGTSLMISIATTLVVVGVFFAIAGWLASPTGAARSVRRFCAPALRDWAPWVYTGLGLLVCIYFLTAPAQGLRSFLTTLIVAAMAAFGIHELRKQTAEEFPDGDYGDFFGRTRERIVGAVREANIPERAAKIRLPEMRRPGGAGTGGAPPGAGPGGATGPTATATTALPVDPEDARLARLERLASLREKGVLTDEEFAAEKERLLGT